MEKQQSNLKWIIAIVAAFVVACFLGVLFGALVVSSGTGDAVEPVEVEVTRIVELAAEGADCPVCEEAVAGSVEVEVTRIVEVASEPAQVEVEVTRLVEAVVTATPTPEPVAPSQSTIEKTQADLAEAFVSDLEGFSDVERVNTVRFEPGRMEVELYTVWASRDNQPDVSWKIVTTIAEIFAETSPAQRLNITGSEELVFALTTYSTDGDYRYQSETDIATFVKLNNRTMTYDEWVAAANAGFR